MKVKLLIALGSLLFSLLVLEIVLRYVGPMVQRSENIYRAENLAPGPKILAVGDSFTHGGMSGRDETYPYYLEQMINAPAGDAASSGKAQRPRYRVVNAGVCAVNTRELWEYLPGWIETFEPEAMLLLVGSANWFSSWDYELHRKGDWLSRIKRLIFKSRVMKMLLFFRLELIGQGLYTDESPPEHYRLNKGQDVEPPPSAWRRYRSRAGRPRPEPAGEGGLFPGAVMQQAQEKAAAGAQAVARGDPVALTLLQAEALFQAGRFQEMDELLVSAATSRPEEQVLSDALAYYRRETADQYRRDRRRYESLDWYLKAMDADPKDPDNVSWMSLMFLLQSRYSAAEVQEILEGIKGNHPELAADDTFRRCEELFEQRRADQADLGRLTRSDLRPVADLCRDKGVRLLVLSYPISYPLINNVLKDLAHEHQLPFVDNLAVFEGLTPREAYILDDEHCTPAGHRVMAGNVHQALIEQGILTP